MSSRRPGDTGDGRLRRRHLRHHQGSLSAGADYTIGFTSGTLTVNTAALTITANDASKTYGAALPAFTASYSGLVNGDTSSVVSGLSLSTTATAASNAGTYAITPGGATASNYAIAYASGTLNVNPAALTVTANSASKTYGAALPALTYSDAGLVNGDTASVFSAPSRHRQRPPPASATTSSTRARSRPAANYTIGFTSGTLTVNTAALTITANDASKTYGAALPALTYSDSGLVNGDTASVFSGALATPATAASGVGNYAITQGSLSAGGNYTIAYTSGTLTVNTAALTITANDASKTYGAALPR